MMLWHEDAGSGLSRNIDQLDIRRRTLQILDDLSRSAQFGSLLTGVQLSHRRLLLEQEIEALVMLSKSKGVRSLVGQLLLWCLKCYGAIYRRLPFTARMITRVTGNT
jgi:hypothetical protein